ncbi:hypothetical protein EG68_12227 [Paragonimus skrjabini miyazakii]|uniref:EGF-like domain-containing protein n=1 Tax=Paragonimus skrjabini miyazakii TaxID=59628 RepID=A0A8S9YA95_9TREM|nr:hypothetical protein EG68_12227 [Paragonimus skrjabini miyazakii]
MWIGRIPAVQARCVCNEGWTGEQCAHPLVRNAWTPWSPWSLCEPACQTSFRQLPPSATRELVPISENTPKWGMRQRTRFRDCVGGSSDCRQEMLERSADMELSIEDGESLRQFERRACRPRPCDRHLFLSTRKRSMKQSGVQKQVRDTLRQANTVHLWTLLAFTFVFAIFGVVAAFATKIHHEKVYELPPVNRPRKPQTP